MSTHFGICFDDNLWIHTFAEHSCIDQITRILLFVSIAHAYHSDNCAVYLLDSGALSNHIFANTSVHVRVGVWDYFEFRNWGYLVLVFNHCFYSSNC